MIRLFGFLALLFSLALATSTIYETGYPVIKLQPFAGSVSVRATSSGYRLGIPWGVPVPQAVSLASTTNDYVFYWEAQPTGLGATQARFRGLNAGRLWFDVVKLPKGCYTLTAATLSNQQIFTRAYRVCLK